MTLSSDKINWLGTWALYKKEVTRFIKVYNQTLLAPVITSLIFLAIFHLAMGDKIKTIEGVPFSLFMSSGLIIMSVVQNAFSNTSSTLVMGKVIGTYIDYIMPPFSPAELLTAMVLGAVTRGVIVGVLVFIAMYFFVELKIYHLEYVIIHLILASTLLALLGIFTGVVAETFDQMSAVTSYIITPLSFLSGTFYSVKSLPEFLYFVSHINPFFYMIDGFRYGMTDYHDGSLMIGILYLSLSIIVLWIFLYYAIKKGWRIKN